MTTAGHVSNVYVGTSTATGQALEASHNQLVHLRSLAEQYDALVTKLATFTNEPRYDATIPLGPYAAMPGQLVNTNAILVPLGEDYHVEYSAKQAREVALRRRKEVDDRIHQIETDVAALTKQLAEEAQLDDDMHINEKGEVLNAEGLPFVEVAEVETESETREQLHENARQALIAAPRQRDRARLARLLAEAEEEENEWLTEAVEAGHTSDLIDEGLLPADGSLPSPAPRPSHSPASSPRISQEAPSVRPSALAERRQSSSTKKVAFDLPPEAETPDKPSTAAKYDATPSRPIKDAVVEKPPTAAPPTPSAKALGKRPATDLPPQSTRAPSLADKVIIKEVVERPPRSVDVQDPGLDDDEEDDDDDTDDTSDEGSNFDYGDEDELEDFAERMDELMMQREAALAYHLQRAEQVSRVEHDPALAENEMADDEGNVWEVSVGQQSRFRGGPNRTASVIIPALQVPRETAPPLAAEERSRDRDFHVEDPAYSAQERELVRERLARLEEGLEMVPEAAEPATMPAGAVKAVDEQSAPPPVTHEVRERLTSSTGAPPMPSGPQPPKKTSRFRAARDAAS